MSGDRQELAAYSAEIQSWQRKAQGIDFIRGAKPTSFEQARKSLMSLKKETDYGICWGGINLPSSAAQNHFCAVGLPGSGKTLTLRLMMQSVLPLIGLPCKNALHKNNVLAGKVSDGGCDDRSTLSSYCQTAKHRALVYDIKKELLGCLPGMSLNAPVYVLDPFNVNSYCWDIAKDVNSESRAWEFASILIADKPDKEKDDFFIKATRICVFNVLLVLMRKKPGKWTFRDFVFAMLSWERITDLLKVYPDTHDSLKNLAGNHETFSNIIADIETYIRPLSLAAGVWQIPASKGKLFSFQAWSEGESIVVLGGQDDYRSSVDPINRVMFGIAAKILNTKAEVKNTVHGDRTWVYLDELANAGELPQLPQLMTMGRSKGVCVIIGFQSTSGLRRVFREDVATELLEMCGNKVILRCNDKTAEWAAKQFGQVEFYENKESITSGTSGSKAYSESSSEAEATGETTGSSTGETGGSTRGYQHGYSAGSSGGQSNYSHNMGWNDGSSHSLSKGKNKGTSQQKTKSRGETVTTTEGWNNSTTINRERLQKDLVLASQITNIPVDISNYGLNGLMLNYDVGAYGFRLDGNYLFENGMRPSALRPVITNANDYAQHPAKPLERWSVEEYLSFGIVPRNSATSSADAVLNLPPGMRKNVG